jgi:signal transduction histidine kinase
LDTLLRQLTEAMTSRTRIPITIQASGDCILPSDVKIALYRIAQEALNNVTKHARASQAMLELHCQPGRARLAIVDNGRGFTPDQRQHDQLGMGIMHERADAIGAKLKIESQPTQGTSVLVEWWETDEQHHD